MTTGNGTIHTVDDSDAPESDVSNSERLARLEEWSRDHERDQRARDATLSTAILTLTAEGRADREVASHRHDAVMGGVRTLTDWANRHDAQHLGQDRHRAQLDSVHEERDAAIESKADRALAVVGKGGVLAFAGGGLITLLKYLFF